MQPIVPIVPAERTDPLDLISAQLSAIGAQLSLLCRLIEGETPAEIAGETPELAEAPARLHLVT